VTGELLLTAFLDANALYPAELRNLLMRLALAEAYRPLWSDRVQKEWTEALARDRADLPREKIERVRALMERHIPRATVEGYEVLVGRLALPDDGDRHVLAAAIKGDAEILVTANLKHFPAPALAPHGIEALHPDEFVLRLIERVPARVLAAARDHRQSLKNPPKSVEEYLAALERVGLVGTVAALRPLGSVLE
jgi:PIN domain-containing protein